MLYSKRTVRCAARGLSREEAKVSLERQFTGSEILGIKRQGEKWVATLLEPKHAEFPPPKDEDSDSEAPPTDDSGDESSPSESSDDGESSGPPKPKGEGEEGPKGKGGEKAEIAAALDLLHQIADALGIIPAGAAPGAEDPLAPGGPPPPPPGPPGGGGAGGPGLGGPGHQEVIHRTKMKPGDTPPGVTPIGAPAFASVKTQLSRMASFDAFDDTPGKTVKQAKAELEALYGPHGFKVRQIRRVEGGKRLAAKLSRR